MKFSQFTTVKVGGMDVVMFCSRKRRASTHLCAHFCFRVNVSSLGCYEASCQSTNSLKDLKVHHQLYKGKNTRLCAGPRSGHGLASW